MRKTVNITTALALTLIILSSEIFIRDLTLSQIIPSEITSETESLNASELIYNISHISSNYESISTKKEAHVLASPKQIKKVIDPTYTSKNSICIWHCTFLI